MAFDQWLSAARCISEVREYVTSAGPQEVDQPWATDWEPILLSREGWLFQVVDEEIEPVQYRSRALAVQEADQFS